MWRCSIRKIFVVGIFLPLALSPPSWLLPLDITNAPSIANTITRFFAVVLCHIK